jgi:uncharacterized glyoxalase superfamily protein PhnB
MPAKAKPRAKKESSRPEQSLTPYLYYADVDAALGFLSKAFGFKQTGMKMKGPDGKTNHAAMKLTGGEIFMLGYPGPKYKNPKQLGNVTQGLYITIDDVDKHFLRASKAGAKIIDEPADQFYGDRRYSAADPEGHHWYFAQPVRKVSAKQTKRDMDEG